MQKVAELREGSSGHMSQLMLFLRKEVAFAQEEAWEEAKHMTAVQWWLAWGAEVPVLQSVALKVLYHNQSVSVASSVFGPLSVGYKASCGTRCFLPPLRS